MKFTLMSAFMLIMIPAWSQKETNLTSNPEKVTVFFEGAQITQSGKVNLTAGRQLVVFKKLTDELDEQSVRIKGKGDFTILSVKTRKNFEDQVSQNEELETLNNKKEKLEDQINTLQDEDNVYVFDETVIRANYKLKSEKQGIEIAELKEATVFFHTKMQEIKTQRRNIQNQLEDLILKLNKIQQEIHARRSKPIINYSEVVVEIDANTSGMGAFELTYISPAASWTPYYDLRAEGINKPIRLESKAKVRQNTGIDWSNIDLTLSTNNPYENTQEPILKPLYLYYNNYYYASSTHSKRSFTKDYSGQTIKGRVIDYETGKPLPFCNVSIPGTNKITQTDFDGKFSIMVPEGHNNINVAFVGYNTFSNQISGAYMKIFMRNYSTTLPQGELQQMSVRFTDDVAATVAGVSRNKNKVPVRGSRSDEEYYYIDGIKTRGNVDKKLKEASYSSATIASKDMRVEYKIEEKFTIPADGANYGVNITSYDLKAIFEYHAVPKIDPSVFLVAQVYGWEKYNLLNAETNLYFDGTYIGKSNIDVSLTKDTINFSLGKEKGISITRKKVEAMCKEKLLGKRKSEDLTYQIEVRNNSGSNIPILIKDQFPISRVDDIKVKVGKYELAKLDEKTGVLLWKSKLNKGEKASFQFSYSVEYSNDKYLRLE